MIFLIFPQATKIQIRNQILFLQFSLSFEKKKNKIIM